MTRPIYRHPTTVCPQCGKYLDSLAQIEGVEHATPQPGDYSVCIGCHSVLELTHIGGYRVLSQQEQAALSDEEQIDLGMTLASLELFESWKRSAPGW